MEKNAKSFTKTVPICECVHGDCVGAGVVVRPVLQLSHTHLFLVFLVMENDILDSLEDLG